MLTATRRALRPEYPAPSERRVGAANRRPPQPAAPVVCTSFAETGGTPQEPAPSHVRDAGIGDDTQPVCNVRLTLSEGEGVATSVLGLLWARGRPGQTERQMGGVSGLTTLRSSRSGRAGLVGAAAGYDSGDG